MSAADSGSRPQLAVVEEPTSCGEGDRGKRPSAPESGMVDLGSRRTGRTRNLLWLAAVVWLGVLLMYEFRHASQLEVRVDELTAELGQAREALGIYQRRLGRVRQGLDELAGRVATLQELVSEDALPDSGAAPRPGGESALHPSEGPADSVLPSVPRVP